jgi:hypothetical protein
MVVSKERSSSRASPRCATLRSKGLPSGACVRIRAGVSIRSAHDFGPLLTDWWNEKGAPATGRLSLAFQVHAEPTTPPPRRWWRGRYWGRPEVRVVTAGRPRGRRRARAARPGRHGEGKSAPCLADGRTSVRRRPEPRSAGPAPSNSRVLGRWRRRSCRPGEEPGRAHHGEFVVRRRIGWGASPVYALQAAQRSSVIKSYRSHFWLQAQVCQQAAGGGAQFLDFSRWQIGFERRLDPVDQPPDGRPPPKLD